MDVKDLIKLQRIKIGLSQKEVADKVGVSEATVSRWESGFIANMRRDRIEKLAKALEVSPMQLMVTSGEMPTASAHAPPMCRIPIVGEIRAGCPILAEENIEGYECADIHGDQRSFFYLRVKGDSMIGARIHDGDLVLIRQQPCAEDGQIVACLINGDEATLKRFYKHGHTVILKPENSAYSPVLVPCEDFDNGYARILGVVTEVKFKL